MARRTPTASAAASRGDGVAESVDVAGISDAMIRIVLEVMAIPHDGSCIARKCREASVN
jgi:hypothetical protein